MSKKKNTLKDLDEFLKQQAATLVTPGKLSGKTEQATQQSATEQLSPATASTPELVSAEEILENLKKFSRSETDFRKKFYDLIIKSMEAQKQSLPEDKMLINTALYLKHGERWKEAIREYWRNAE